MAGIASKTGDWENCGGIDGFVGCEQGQRGSTALAVWNLVGALMAPGLVCALDANDLLTVMGTAVEPSWVCEGVWIPGDAELMVSTSDRAQFDQCTALAFMPGRPLAVAAHHELTTCLRALAAPDAEVVAIAPYRLTIKSIDTRALVEICLLCR